VKAMRALHDKPVWKKLEDANNGPDPDKLSASTVLATVRSSCGNIYAYTFLNRFYIMYIRVVFPKSRPVRPKRLGPS
jgi:hypothetical protein